MKKQVIALLLLALTGLCFKSGDDDVSKDKGSFYATIDGHMFRLQENQLFRGTLIKKSGSMDGRTPGKTAIFNCVLLRSLFVQATVLWISVRPQKHEFCLRVAV